MFGLAPSFGEVELRGRSIPRSASSADQIADRIGYLSEDRKDEGLYLQLSVADNLTALYRQRSDQKGHARIKSKDDAHGFLSKAYEYRIKQALEGKRHAGPLPTEELQTLEIMDRLLRYVVDRLRKHSFILEPDERINPYRHWGARISEFEKALAELTDVTDRQEVVNRVERMLRDVPKGAKGAEPRARVLRAALEVAPRVNEDFARRGLGVRMLLVLGGLPGFVQNRRTHRRPPQSAVGST